MMRYARVAGLAALMVALAIGFASPASAHTSIHAFSPANGDSTAFAGYVESESPAGNGTLTASFVVPDVTCPPTGTVGMAPSAYLFTSKGLATGAAVLIQCTNHSVFYNGLIDLKGASHPTKWKPRPGDTIIVTASLNSKQSKATLDDVTLNKSKSGKGFGGSVDEAFFGVQTLVGKHGTEPIPTFTTDTFSNCSFKGMSLAAATAYDLTDSKSNVEISTGPLNSSNNGFVETFESNS